MQFTFKKDLYHKSALLKAAYNFTDRAYIHIDANDDYYIVDIEMKNEYLQISEKDFQNEMIAQMVRLDIQSRTKRIRELTLARALSSTVIEDTQIEEPVAENINIDDILQDWFEKYE